MSILMQYLNNLKKKSLSLVISMCLPVDKDIYASSQRIYVDVHAPHKWCIFIYYIPHCTWSCYKTGNYFLQECAYHLGNVLWPYQYSSKVNQCLERSIIIIAGMYRVLTTWQALCFVSYSFFYLCFADKKIQARTFG